MIKLIRSLRTPSVLPSIRAPRTASIAASAARCERCSPGRAQQRGQSELAVDVSLRLGADSKQAIAGAAAGMVEEGELVALDCSSTAYYLAHDLRSKRDLFFF